MNFERKEFAKRWPESKISSFNVVYTWKIDQFMDKFASENVSIKSPKFPDDIHGIQFDLELSSTVFRECNEKFLVLLLGCYPGKTINSEVPITFNIAFLDKDDKVKKSLETSFTYKDATTSCGFFNFLKLSDVVDSSNKFLHENGQLHIRCKTTGRYTKVSKFILKQASHLESGNHSDFTIIVNGEEKHVHKAILALCSPVFNAMFSHNDTKEARENKVVISDVSADVMKDFLQFIYTGIRPKGDRQSMDLLVVADKYQVEELKFYCEDYLSSVLDVENVVNSYQLAVLYIADTLKANCLNFMASKFDQVVKTKDWERLFMVDGVETALKVTRAIGEAFASKKKP